MVMPAPPERALFSSKPSRRRADAWWVPRSSKPVRGLNGPWRVRFPSASAIIFRRSVTHRIASQRGLQIRPEMPVRGRVIGRSRASLPRRIMGEHGSFVSQENEPQVLVDGPRLRCPRAFDHLQPWFVLLVHRPGTRLAEPLSFTAEDLPVRDRAFPWIPDRLRLGRSVGMRAVVYF